MQAIFKSTLILILMLAAAPLSMSGTAWAAGNTGSTSSDTSTTSSNATNMSNARSAAVSAAGAAIGQQAVGGVPYGVVQQVPDKPLVNTTGSSCQCKVGERDGSACMIFLRTSAADWIKQNEPQTRMRSSPDGRYYDAPFPLAASACAGRNVNPAGIKVHWLDKQTAILEWR